MSIIENPVKWLIGALCLLAFFMLLFKVLNAIEDKKAKSKSKESDKKKEDAPIKDDKSASNFTAEKIVDDENIKSDYFNYLHDRFVTNPSGEDNVKIKSISDAFLTGEECECIKHNKVHIHVTPVKKLEESKPKDIKSMIENIIDENKTTKSKLLQEFEGLSREMKLLLIENIMSRK